MTKARKISTVTVKERNVLHRHEAVIAKGLGTFMAVGQALMAIMDDLLFRDEYPTFREYVEERWEMSDRRARQLIGAAQVTNKLKSGTFVPLLPKVEAHARPLCGVKKDDLAKVWEQVIETAPKDKKGEPQITEALVKDTVKEWKDKPSTKPRSKRKGTKAFDDGQIDRALERLHSLFGERVAAKGESAEAESFIDRLEQLQVAWITLKAKA